MSDKKYIVVYQRCERWDDWTVYGYADSLEEAKDHISRFMREWYEEDYGEDESISQDEIYELMAEAKTYIYCEEIDKL